ncbi:MAG: glycosyltransferase family 4 protein [Vicinamibacterales bacterium]
MNVLYLTNNFQLASTARILMSWLTEGPKHDVHGRAVVQRLGSLSEWFQANGIPWKKNAMRWPDLRRPHHLVADVAPLALWAKREQIALIHCNEHDVYPFGVLLKRVLGVPIVCHVRFRISPEYAAWAFGGSRCPDALLWTSRQQMTDCGDAVQRLVPASRQHLMPLGVDLTSFGSDTASGVALRQRLGIRQDEIVIGTASALRPIKRIHELITLIAEVAQRHPSVVGVIGGVVMPGDEAYGARLKEQADATGLGRRLQFIGHVEPVEPLHQASDIFVSTSEYETFGNSVCEAMACGKPVVGYQGGSVAEVVAEGGIILPTGDLAGLTAAVERLVADPELRRSTGAAGLARVRSEFDPSRTFLRLKQVFETLTTR